MKKSLKLVFLTGSLLILLLFILFAVNQTVQIVDLASRLNPMLGVVVLWTLLGIYAAVLLVPIIIFLRLPAPLRPPGNDRSADFPNYLKALRKRLTMNRHLAGRSLAGRQDIEEALAFLNAEADNIIKSTASRVFITTGISQSGRLDALLVLSAVSRMVWQIAYLFYQRPTPGEIVRLYANVGATVFLVGELDDIDVHHHIEPILVAGFGSAVSTVPGTGLLINSILTASGNALLTLRVGAITKRYCGSLCIADRRSMRRAATVEALGMFGTIVGQCTATISKAAWDVSKKTVTGKISGAGSRLKQTAQDLFHKTGASKKGRPAAAEKPADEPLAEL
jgi:hypothetical protein